MTGSRLQPVRALVLAVCVALLAAAPARAQPVLAPPVTVAGPSSAIDALGGLSIARDGTGGLVFTESLGGVAHVFVSRLAGGSFQAPQQVDTALAGASAQPVIAAGPGGLLLVAFINGGELYVADAGSGATGFGPPQRLAGGASNPAISASNFPKAYLAFTVADGAGDDVRAAYYDAGRWALESAPLNRTPADDAGVGTGRPAVVCAGDGVGIVSWGEAGHVDARRVWGTAPSTELEQADPPTVAGLSEVSADEPSIGAGGDSSYADVAFRETLRDGATTESRVLVSRLVAEAFSPAIPADGLGTGASLDGSSPSVVMGEYGRGFVLSAHSDSGVFGLALGTDGVPGAGTPLDPGSLSLAAPDPVGGTAGLYSSLAAWQQSALPGAGQLDVAFGTDGAALGPAQTASSPADGGTDAAAGIAASGDVNGDAAAAWVQGAGALTRIVTAQLYQPPGSFGAVHRTAYTDHAQPTFSWSPAREAWGPVAYSVSLDGSPLGTTAATSLVSPAVLPNGAHSWQVTAVNRAGLSDTAGSATVHVDTLAPVATLRLAGGRRPGDTVTATVRDSDVRPGEAPAVASGIATATLSWGDGTEVPAGRRARHVYGRPGRFTVTLTVTDRAGNVTRVARTVQIRRPPARHRSHR